MGMPITVEVVGPASGVSVINEVFDYFKYVEETFSVYKPTSEISKINAGTLTLEDAHPDVREIFRLAEQTKKDTGGYFDIVNRKGLYDPSGIVKGWAIYNAAKLLAKKGFSNYYVDAGGDIQVSGKNADGKAWSIGIADPFQSGPGKYGGIVKVLHIENGGVATSGTYVRGQHIYDPFKKEERIQDIVSITVIGPNVYEADLFATAAFAMGKRGIELIEATAGLEAYMIDSEGVAYMTSNFETYT
jgi:thiamine biosynthesis lipoprotein